MQKDEPNFRRDVLISKSHRFKAFSYLNSNGISSKFVHSWESTASCEMKALIFFTDILYVSTGLCSPARSGKYDLASCWERLNCKKQQKINSFPIFAEIRSHFCSFAPEPHNVVLEAFVVPTHLCEIMIKLITIFSVILRLKIEEMVNWFNQLLWQNFQLNFWKINFFPLFFHKKDIKYAYFARFVQFDQWCRQKNWWISLALLRYGLIVIQVLQKFSGNNVFGIFR